MKIDYSSIKQQILDAAELVDSYTDWVDIEKGEGDYEYFEEYNVYGDISVGEAKMFINASFTNDISNLKIDELYTEDVELDEYIDSLLCSGENIYYNIERSIIAA
jgi:hypothetical protein